MQETSEKGPLFKFQSLYPVLLLLGFAAFFSYDLVFLKRYMAHPEYVSFYPSFRHWFHQQLLHGKFPQWNPYWGLGHSTDIASGFPVDIFSPLEFFLGPQYHLFQGLQCVALLLAVYFSFKSFKIAPLYSCFGSILFLLSPWVNYFFFYYLKPSIFIMFALSTAFLHQFLQNEQRASLKYLYGFTGILLIGYFGAKLEYLFFINTYFLAFLCFQVSPKDPKFKMACLAMVFALLAHIWQWIPLLQILKESNRLDSALGLQTFTNVEFYSKLLASLSSSDFLKLVIIAAMARFLSRLKNRIVQNLGLSALLILALSKLSFHSYFNSSFGIGLGLAILALALIEKKSLNDLLLSLCFYLPIAYYWCRPLPGDVREVTVLHLAPRGIALLFGFIWFLGVSTIRKDKRAKLFYTLILFLFVIREQGQILMAFTTGALWIPTRDNFIFDFTLTLLGLVGLSQLRLPSKKTKLLAAILILFLIFSSAKNCYYSNDLIRTVSKDYPAVTGIKKYQELFHHNDNPLYRGYLFDLVAAFPLPQFGASLFERKATVQMMSSLLSKRYRNWTIFQRYGFKPEEHWAGYENEYTSATISHLPKRNHLGLENTVIYWNTLHAFPPPNPNALRLLSVTDLYYEGEIKPLPGLIEIKKEGAFNTAKLIGSLPRSYLLSNLSPKELESLKEDLNPKVEPHHISGNSYRVPYEPTPIQSYQNERVTINTQLKTSSVLVLADLYHPFWKVRVDGTDAEIFPVFYLFRGVKLNSGPHRVEFYCEIPGLTFGFLLSGLLFVFFLLIPLLLRICGAAEKRLVLSHAPSLILLILVCHWGIRTMDFL